MRISSEPPYFDGYQIDLNGSNLSIDGTSSTLSAWFGTIQKAQGLVGAGVDHSLSSLSDLLYYIRYIYTEGASSTVTGSFDYVYKSRMLPSSQKTQQLLWVQQSPFSSFITSATDENGDSIAPSAINSPDYDSISTATKGDYTFKVEYFNIDNVSILKLQPRYTLVTQQRLMLPRWVQKQSRMGLIKVLAVTMVLPQLKAVQGQQLLCQQHFNKFRLYD